MRRLYDWVLHFERSPHAGRALFLLAFAESSVFPVPPDVLLIALALSAPARALRYALVCSAGSVLGGICGFAIGALVWHQVDDFFFRFVFSREVFDRVADLYRGNAFWAVFTAGFTPIPYKVFTIAGGVFGISLPVFVLASALSRSARFFLVAALLRRYGPPVKLFIDRHFGWLSIVFVALLIAGFAAVRYLL
jgi:membrane protein YqaA with SNARE-associated domain